MTRFYPFLLTVLLLSFASEALCVTPLHHESTLGVISEGNLEERQRMISAFTDTGQLDSALILSREILRYAEETENEFLEFSVASTIGQIFLMRDEYDSSYVYLSRCRSIWEEAGDTFSQQKPRPIYRMFNSLAIHAVNAEMDYEKATEYIIEGLKMSRLHPDDPDYAIMGQNLVMIFFIRQNPAGLKYAQEIYQDGVKRNNDLLKYSGAYGSAQMYCLKGEYDEAYRYIREANRLVSRQDDKIILYTLYGDIFAGKNRPDSARIYYQKAVDLAGSATVVDISYLSLSYGSFLREQGDLERSEEVLMTGLESCLENDNKVFSYRLYEELSKLYSDMEENDRSLEFYKKYLAESESVFNIQRERAINELTFKYESERHENELSQHRLQYMKQRHQLQVLIIVILLFCVISVIVFIMYRNKNRMYTKMVRQYRDAIASENHLVEQISVLEQRLERNRESHLPEEASASDEKTQAEMKDEEIFMRIEAAMTVRHLYRDNTLTRDKLAEIIGTNRTYVTRVVGEKSGKSFNQYINSYRIKEALTLLSDPSEDVPLKALSADIGFSSLTTFYKVFKEEVGMTPAKYKEKIVQLSGKG